VRARALLAAGALALLAAGPAHGEEAGAARRVEIPLANSPTRGPADAPVTIVEFLDFQ